LRRIQSIGFQMLELQRSVSTASKIGVDVLLLVGFGASLATSRLLAAVAFAYWTVRRSAGFRVTARRGKGGST